MTLRSLRILAAVYLVKVLVLAAVWLAAPELPRRVWVRVRQAVSVGTSAQPQESAEDPATR